MSATAAPRRNLLIWGPLALFGVLAAFLFVGLFRDPREVPSPLVDRPAPEFSLATLHAPGKVVSTSDYRGQVWLLNVWASWCVSCRVEHPLLMELAKANVVPIVGLDYKDKDAEAKAWLEQHGNPYALSVVDADGRVGIDWGVYGVPETYVIGKDGRVRYRHVSPITPEVLERTLLPLLARLERE